MIAHFGWYQETTQNVLAVCDFDMRFTFVIARWLGSVPDMRVFKETLDKYADATSSHPQLYGQEESDMNALREHETIH
jgi:hypothetical protein